MILFGLFACAANPTPPPSHGLVEGQVLLPTGKGLRGAEVWHRAGDTGARAEVSADGRFTIEPSRWPLHLSVTAAGVEVVGLDVEEPGTVELDARSVLVPHIIAMHSTSAEHTGGEVRVAVWAGEIPRGPLGSHPSLGSAQFEERELPHNAQWLLPIEAESFSFLVERPLDDARGRNWRSGAQHVYGPYAAEALPNRFTIP